MLIEEYFGYVPDDVKEPAINFLAQNRVVLEKFFSIQAYQMMKRARNDEKNTERYMGVLIHIRSLLSAIQKGRIVKEEVTVADPEENPLEKVKAFLEGFKSKSEKK